MGSNKTITVFYETFVVVQANLEALVVTFVGKPDINVGVLHSLYPDLQQSLSGLSASVSEVV